MRIVIQRVTESTVKVNNQIIGSIQSGLLILVGIEDADAEEDIKWLSNKAVNLRIFNDENGHMNLSVKDVSGSILLASQFTLHADTKKGNRPSFIKAAKPPIAIPLYNQFIQQLETDLGKPIQTGDFGAEMQISLVNDGPVTIFIDSKNR
ncbi:MAG: D-tyrosyl-tRNA(Tyr) deacylase [Bacteroidia bacterium]|nr:D-tyrosyl-tRNA(Tyr) deacylase [Bacteroidia bacterium]